MNLSGWMGAQCSNEVSILLSYALDNLTKTQHSASMPIRLPVQKNSYHSAFVNYKITSNTQSAGCGAISCSVMKWDNMNGKLLSS